MSEKVYINGIGALSSQGQWHHDLFREAKELSRAVTPVNAPSYKGLIAPGMLRRMSSGVKMGIYASQQALDEASISIPEAIITGTGLGCLIDSEKFLHGVLDNQEEFLTPTAFIQSTHNTVAAQIALRLGCNGYNFTYVHRSVSFESALLDALMQLQDDQASTVLVGGVDEISPHTYRLLQLAGQIKQNDRNERVKNSESIGVNYAEGATFFTLSTLRTQTSYAQLVDLTLQHELNKEEVTVLVADFMARQDRDHQLIDALVVGINGDCQYDGYYDEFSRLFDNIPVLYYKHLTGQYDTASAFGLAVAARVLKEQEIPEVLYWNSDRATTGLRNILVYNQFNGKDHSLTLVRVC
ncbi:beta-ketoacyl synthase N-terminal-like domain-containing protein [Sphingobacterium sp. JB170]|uniref:beta-ketoacyl synthase N-terminal-like domain-containing protein n=1 Tax=Sphingobacterium sp. JB170 TaxID=1434842 RepID=UPI00097F015F|nr:beta-ketoacyl synthase N-terminal-like domain-containing protein [Sphingobacterium sp. JB170]SJN44321.1 3-oxoacyl-[acyl-carrier protein] reductase [Sphingobacterium sp. JB170]